MKKTVLMVLVSLGVSLSTYAQSSISSAKAAELGCHRIERLVTLKKIEESFLNKLYALQIVRLNQNVSTDPAFRIVGLQVPGQSGVSKKIEIMADGAGKAVSHQVVDGEEAGEPVWPEKDAVTLFENALHYILDNGSSQADVKPFFTALQEAVLSQGTDAQGKVLAKVIFKSSTTNDQLEVILKANGSFVSAKILK